MKTYLGDGCYAEDDGHVIVLTTEDSVRESDRIYLEPEVYRALVRFHDAVFGDAAENGPAASGDGR